MHSQVVKLVLESKLLETTNPAGWRDSIAVRTSADPTDTTQQIGEREMAGRSLNRNASLVRDLRAALNRVAENTYGVCIDRCMHRLRRANRSEASGGGAVDGPLPILPERPGGGRSRG
jgi:hypothetical protein